MSKLILHAGMPKTGSTSIQFALFGFDNERFSYPFLGGVSHNKALLSLLSKNQKKHHLYKGVLITKNYIRKIHIKLKQKKILNTETNKTLILSAEVLPFLSKQEIFELKNILNELMLNDISIIAYIRTPIEYITSGFQQVLKNSFINFGDFTNLLPNYKTKFEKFDELFGKENVYLYKFDKNKFPDGNVVFDFFKRIGVNMDQQKIFFVNESLSMETVKFIYTFKKYTNAKLFKGEAQWLSSFISKALGKKNKFRISPKVIIPFIKSLKDDIDWMEKKLGVSLTESIGELPQDIKTENDLINIDKEILKTVSMALEIPKFRGEKNSDIITLFKCLRRKYRESFLKTGMITIVKSNLISGYAIGDHFDGSLEVALYINNILIDKTNADQFKLGLRMMGGGTGKYSFSFQLTRKLNSGDIIEIKCLNGECKIYNSPLIYNGESYYITEPHIILYHKP